MPKAETLSWPSSAPREREQGGFCRVCRSHFCPHAAPILYGRRLALVSL
jgi:hypothetical protein